MKYIIALVVIVIAIPAAAEDIRIRHYTHEGCVVGGERILPAFALDGLIARIPEASYWDCENVVDSATLSCRWADDFVYSFQREQHPECLDVFAAEISDCLAHYKGERTKCSVDSASPDDRHDYAALDLELDRQANQLKERGVGDSDLDNALSGIALRAQRLYERELEQARQDEADREAELRRAETEAELRALEQEYERIMKEYSRRQERERVASNQQQMDTGVGFATFLQMLGTGIQMYNMYNQDPIPQDSLSSGSGSSYSENYAPPKYTPLPKYGHRDYNDVSRTR